MRHYLQLIIIFFALAGCGTTGPLWLPDGVEDKSKYKYPLEIETSCMPSDEKCKE